MLTFITFIDAPEQLEIIGDKEGLEDLIEYLEAVKNSEDHMHLTVNNELENIPIYGDRIGKTLNAKYVKIQYEDKDKWNS